MLPSTTCRVGEHYIAQTSTMEIFSRCCRRVLQRKEIGVDWILTVRKKLIIGVASSCKTGHHAVVVHALVQGHETGSPSGDGRGSRCSAGSDHWGSNQAESGRADHATESRHWAEARIGENLQGKHTHIKNIVKQKKICRNHLFLIPSDYTVFFFRQW